MRAQFIPMRLPNPTHRSPKPQQQENKGASEPVMRRDGGGGAKGTAGSRRCANHQEVYPTSALCALVEAGDVQALNKAIQEDEGCVRVARSGMCCCRSSCPPSRGTHNAREHSATTAPSGPWRRTLLHVASETGQAQCAQLLLSKGARVAAVSRHVHSRTPVALNFTSSCLLNAQADSEGTAALHLAAALGHDQVVHLLLLHKADVFMLDG